MKVVDLLKLVGKHVELGLRIDDENIDTTFIGIIKDLSEDGKSFILTNVIKTVTVFESEDDEVGKTEEKRYDKITIPIDIIDVIDPTIKQE
jgi:hypothetical protein